MRNTSADCAKRFYNVMAIVAAYAEPRDAASGQLSSIIVGVKPSSVLNPLLDAIDAALKWNIISWTEPDERRVSISQRGE
jgi:hypothetical protein